MSVETDEINGSAGFDVLEDLVPGSGRGNRTVMTVAICFGILMALFIGLLATSDSSTGSLESREIEGQVAPLLSGPTITGDTFVLQDLRGQWVLVNFFATWCPGCITEHPELVGEGGEWPVIVDGDTAREFVVGFGVTAVPETYIISPSGRVELKIVSSAGVTADALDRALGLDG